MPSVRRDSAGNLDAAGGANVVVGGHQSATPVAPVFRDPMKAAQSGAIYEAQMRDLHERIKNGKAATDLGRASEDYQLASRHGAKGCELCQGFKTGGDAGINVQRVRHITAQAKALRVKIERLGRGESADAYAARMTGGIERAAAHTPQLALRLAAFRGDATPEQLRALADAIEADVRKSGERAAAAVPLEVGMDGATYARNTAEARTTAEIATMRRYRMLPRRTS